MDAFFEHLRDPSPGFRCYRPSRDETQLEHQVHVQHFVGDPATDEDLAEIQRRLGPECDDMKALYSKCNGLLLYCQGEETPGLALFPVEHWDDKNAERREWFEHWDEDDLYEFQKHGIAFGEVCFSGNYFVWYEGTIYYADHDGGDDTPLGDTLLHFLDRIVADPAKFLYDVGCYTRYSDGKTDEQWIPGQYVPDLR